jgi:hypothetical protein
MSIAKTIAKSIARNVAPSVPTEPIAAITGNAPDGQVGATYSFVYVLTGNPLDPTWTITGMPDGVTQPQSNEGRIAGTPQEFGDFEISISVVEGSVTTERTDTITIAPEEIECPDDSPDGEVGVAYSHQFSPAGGAGGYVFSNATGLPNGLGFSLSGLLSGEPSVAGNFSGSVRITDALGDSITISVNILIAEAAPEAPASPTNIVLTVEGT